jgi:FAD/FMN-containing dehydrogenase
VDDVDIAGRALGTPHVVVRATCEDDVARAITVARDERRPFVAVGLRSSYWGNLDLDGAVVLDTTGYARILVVDEENGVASCESGIDLRTLDRALRARGYQLASHPDAHGDTTLGGAIANGTSAGIGMLRQDFASQIAGFEVMLASGAKVQIGASRVLGSDPGAVGAGIPDLRSVFVSGEGALGVITRVDVRLAPVTWEARLSLPVDVDRFDDALALARWWRTRDGVDTIRWTSEPSGHVLALRVASPNDARDLEHRLALVLHTLRDWPAPEIERADDDERAGRSPGYERRWPGPAGSTWANARTHPFAGIDGVVPYADASDAWRWARSIAIEVAHQRRLAAYFGRDGVNIGVHCVFATTSERDRGRAQLDAQLGAYAAFRAVPYRLGRVWIEHVRARLDPATLDVSQRVAAAIDPTRTIGPHVGLFGAAR